MEASVRKSYWQLHIAVFLFGFTAILGKLISLPEVPLVWWRLLFTCLTLLYFKSVRDFFKTSDKKLILQLSANGVLVMLHWVTFYGAIKYSNVSITLSIYATASLFTAFIEPLISRKKIKLSEIWLGLMVLPGIYLVFSFSGFHWLGAFLALISTIFGVLFTIYNKQFTERASPLVITFVELLAGFALLTLLLPVYYFFFPDVNYILSKPIDWLYMAIFVIVCTNIAFVMSIRSLKNLSAFTAMLSFNLEPIYGITLAIFFFQENKELSWQFYLGTFIIVAAIFIQPLLSLPIFRRSVRKLS